MSTHARKAVVRALIRYRTTGPKVGSRYTTLRHLACGHHQEEPSGGRAHLAESAVCRICHPTWKARRRR